MARPAGELPLNDDLLAEVLIRLPTLADLGRACASCTAFRRVITGRSFLRRVHALHRPQLLGLRTFFGFHPAEPPNPSAPAARALAAAADFDFWFLPRPGFWLVRDERGGRFVLDREEEGGAGDAFTTIAVCDPLFRRYVVLPPIPADLAATVQRPHLVSDDRRCDVFLAPCHDGEEAAAGAAPEPFAVIWMARCPSELVAFVFSSARGQWRAVAPASWSDLNPSMPSLTERNSLLFRSYAHGCFYWFLSGWPYHSSLIVLDMDRMQFFPGNHPPGHSLEPFVIVELEENRRGMLMFGSSNYYHGSSLLRFFSANRQAHGDGASEWVLENEVSLSSLYRYSILGVADGKLLLQGDRNVSSATGNATKFAYISLDFKTLQLQEVQGMVHNGFGPLPALYTGYPPSLSLPTI